MVYNVMGSIDERAIEMLSCVAKLSQSITLGNNNKSCNEGEISNYFPSFVWVVRDFALDLKKSDGKEVLNNNLIVS